MCEKEGRGTGTYISPCTPSTHFRACTGSSKMTRDEVATWWGGAEKKVDTLNTHAHKLRLAPPPFPTPAKDECEKLTSNLFLTNICSLLRLLLELFKWGVRI